MGLVIVVFSGAVGTVDLPGVAVDGVRAEGLIWTAPNGHQFSHVWVSSHYRRLKTAHAPHTLPIFEGYFCLIV